MYRVLGVRAEGASAFHSWAGEDSQHEREAKHQEELVRKVTEFRRMLKEPDKLYINEREARRRFALNSDSIEKLDRRLQKENPLEAGGDVVSQYPLEDVVRVALDVYGEESLVRLYIRQLLVFTQQHHPMRREALYGATVVKKVTKPYWYLAPSQSTEQGRKSVQQGLISNSIICAVKGGVWLFTGSQAIFADLMHSTADVVNYMYRLSMLQTAASHADFNHPYGYAPIRYIVADRSFVVLFGLGFVVPIMHATQLLFDWARGGAIMSTLVPDVPGLVAPSLIFLASMLLEGMAARTAFKEILEQVDALTPQEQGRKPPAPSLLESLRACRAYVREGPDVMSVATFLEAASGVVGAGVGLVGLGLTWYLQSGIYDVCASGLMASLVGVVSCQLLSKSSGALLGNTLPLVRVQHIVRQLEARPGIESLFDVKTEVIGTSTVRFKAEVQFNPEAITQGLVDYMRGELQPLGKNPTVKQSLAAEMRSLLPELRRGIPVPEDAENWLHANNTLFYEALAWELKKSERLIRRELSDFRYVHIDLEPW